MKLSDIGRLVTSVVVSLVPGVAGSVFTAPAITGWYATLEKPALNPPNWIFGPVWTTLYVLMGLSLFLVWSKGRGTKNVRLPMTIFGIQLVFNGMWSVVFFGFQNPGAGLAVIAGLWLMIVWTMLAFSKFSKTAVWLLAPYLAWVTFASYLNVEIWRLNSM